MLGILERIEPVKAVVVGEDLAVIRRAESDVYKLLESLEVGDCNRCNAVCQRVKHLVVDSCGSLPAKPLNDLRSQIS